MKHVIIAILSFFLSFSPIAFAWDSNKDYLNTWSVYTDHVEPWKDVTRWDILTFMWNYYFQHAPSSYQYIQVQMQWLNKNYDLYDSLQVLIYFDLIKNTTTNIHSERALNASSFYVLAEKIFGVDFRNEDSISLSSRDTNYEDIINVANQLEKIINMTSEQTYTPEVQEVESIEEDIDISSSNDSENIAEKKAILWDVYKTILSRHYDRDQLNEEEILDAAIQGLANGTWDKYTTYFPPVENKSFQEWLNGEYEWIGSYVDMPAPWIVQIISPIVWSPSEQAGLKGGDIITQVDDVVITENMSLTEAISYIKWPAGTSVTLTVRRGNKTLIVTVNRAKIIIKDVEFESLRSDTFYIQIKNFGTKVDGEFLNAIEELEKRKSTKKVIIDVRNNPGGYLSKVNDILWHFVEKWEPVSIVKYQKSQAVNKSKGFDDIDFSKYQLVFLQNWGTASASEILVWTIKDYYPDAIIIGEQTFGKWSVQDIKSYVDGSSLKFTIAKWYTGKTQQAVDGIWISPDIELKLDDEAFQEWNDNQLNKALQIR